MKHVFTLIVTVLTFSSAATNHQVQVGSNFCNPSRLTVPISDTLTWTQVSGAHDANGSLSSTCADLFFSEYIEGNAFNKAFEIYNPTNAAINLASYSVKVYFNGASTSTTTLQLPNKNLAPDDVYVIAHPSADAAILGVSDTSSSNVANHNGDDAIVLFKNTVAIDIIGVIGNDPGSGWIVGGSGSTADKTLVRKATVNQGQTNWVTGASEWDVYSVGTHTYLGGHISNCPFSGMTWDGSAWSPSTPTSTDNVRLNGNYTVSAGSSFTANNLLVSKGYALTLDASSSGYAQLKVNGSLANQGTIIAKQYMSGTGHHSVSSPMSNGFTTTNGTSAALYAYNASTGAYNMSPTLTSAGRGFFAPLGTSGFLTSAGTFSATGTPNTSHTHTLGYFQTQVSGGSGSGWNLIGNPYTCGLDWSQVSLTNVNNTYYVWDPSTSKYQYNSPSVLSGTYLAASSILSGVIAPMQAFWVQASSSPASIVSTMADDGTVSTTTFYKTAPDNLILYVEDLSDPSLSDAMWITHATGYTNDFEGDQDAWKLHNYGAKASIFSYHNGDKLAINAIDLSSTASVPVGVMAPEVGKKYRLVLEQVVNNQDYRVILEDRLFNSFTDITGQGYGFTYGAWQNEDPRFVVHINQSTVGMGESSASTVKAYQQGERLILQGNGQQHVSYAVSALDGRVIAQGLLQAGMASIVAPQVGVYIVNFIGAAPEAQRVVIQ